MGRIFDFRRGRCGQSCRVATVYTNCHPERSAAKTLSTTHRHGAERGTPTMLRTELQCQGVLPKAALTQRKIDLRPSSGCHARGLDQFWVQIAAALVTLVFFHLNAVGVGVSIVPDARHLP